MEQILFPMELRVAETTEGRTLDAILVPYNEVSMFVPNPGGERFLPKSLNRSASRVTRGEKVLKLFRHHDHSRALAKATDLRSTPESLTGSFLFGTTAAAQEAAQEVREGLLDSLSIGFRAIRERMVGGVREILEAELLEASLTPLAAYEGSRVTGMRSADPATFQLPPPPSVNLDPIPLFR